MIWQLGAVLLAAFLICFELAAVPLPTFGFFTCSQAILGGLCLLPGAGYKHALIALVIALVIRTLVRDIRSFPAAICDFVAQGLGIAFLAVFGKAMGLLSLLPAGGLVAALQRELGNMMVNRQPPSKQRSAWFKAQDWIWQHQVAVLFLAPLVTVMVSAEPFYAFWILPTLGGILRAVRAELIRLKLVDVEDLQKEAQELQQEAQLSKQELKQVSTTLTQTRHSLQLKALRESVLWDLSNQLSQSQGVQATSDLAVAYMLGKLPCDSAGVVVVEDGRPRLKAAHPPGQVRITRLLEAVFREQKPVASEALISADDQPFPGHCYILALPLGREGVLYCGRAQQGPYSEEEWVLLGAVAGQVSLGLQAARRLEEQQNVMANLLQSAKTAAVGQLAAGLAHELNTPLGAMALQMDLAIERRDQPQKVEDRLRAAQRSLAAAQKILKRLLYYSREGAMATHSLDLLQVVQDTLDFLEGSFAQDGVTMVRQLDPIDPLEGNPNQLQQALVNLLLNAREACQDPHAHGKTITVFTGMKGGHRVVRVRDSGPGIPAEIGERIFEPFFTTRPVGQGVGPGLSVAQKIVQNHNGRLTARNTSEGGAEFLILL